MTMEPTPVDPGGAAANGPQGIPETILRRIRDAAGEHPVTQYFRLAAEGVTALDTTLSGHDGAPARAITAALRLEYVLTHGWPRCGRSVHPQLGEPFWHWGDSTFAITTYSSALEAIDAAIAQAGLAVPVQGAPATAPDVVAWDQRLAAAPGPANAEEIGAAKDAELAELRAAREVDHATLLALRDQCDVLQARLAILRTPPLGPCAWRNHAAACVVVIRLLHESGMDDGAIAAQLSLTAEHVGVIRTTSAALGWPELARGAPADERSKFELGEQPAALQRKGPGEEGDYLDGAVENRWRGWLRRAGWPRKPAA